MHTWISLSVQHQSFLAIDQDVIFFCIAGDSLVVAVFFQSFSPDHNIIYTLRTYKMYLKKKVFVWITEIEIHKNTFKGREKKKIYTEKKWQMKLQRLDFATTQTHHLRSICINCLKSGAKDLVRARDVHGFRVQHWNAATQNDRNRRLHFATFIHNQRRRIKIQKTLCRFELATGLSF